MITLAAILCGAFAGVIIGIFVVKQPERKRYEFTVRRRIIENGKTKEVSATFSFPTEEEMLKAVRQVELQHGILAQISNQ